MTQQHALGTQGSQAGWAAGLLRQTWVQRYFPLISSLALHAFLILLVAATYQAVLVARAHVEVQPFIPQTASLTSDGNAIPTGTGQRNYSPESLLTDKTPYHENPEYVNQLLKEIPPAQKGSATGGDATKALDDGFGLLKPTGIGGPKGDPNGKDKGALFGHGPGEGSIFGIPGRGGRPDGKAAESVVFVCDASGSMQSKLDLLVDQLNIRIGKMVERQRFNIIFFRDGKPTCLSETGLMWANKENKEKAAVFLENVVAHSQTDPIPALKIAFAMKPELMYLLTDGAFNNEREVVDFIAKANAGKAVQVMTIAFLEQGDYENVLKKIAEQNGGELKSVKPGDLR